MAESVFTLDFTMNACEMISRCFYHQHPEARGLREIDPPVVPQTQESVAWTESIPEADIGVVEGYHPITAETLGP